ncbi:hypothetical protein CS062_21100 [Roseateles chitinivorans]|uniref:DUF1203 domain-containing protein n=1 Tax=Roseateles chitinivorans TaxID=2917965 RepID=A0A2G9C468_9BURK|nr:DUF1203 domain-containing protein [Roseateles chitinivorans]PIM51178.1 hypothetical protein CS062_21100 [Roseateles chitinivorans]
MDFRILGLDPAPFRPMFTMTDERLRELGVLRVRIDSPRSAPDRITLDDAEPGETVLLLNHVHLEVDSPYRGTHAIYLRENGGERFDRINEVPRALRGRMLSVRALDAAGMMVDADLVDGDRIEPLIERLLAQPAVSYLQVHFAKRGCYAARVERAPEPPVSV